MQTKRKLQIGQYVRMNNNNNHMHHNSSKYMQELLVEIKYNMHDSKKKNKNTSKNIIIYGNTYMIDNGKTKKEKALHKRNAKNGQKIETLQLEYVPSILRAIDESMIIQSILNHDFSSSLHLMIKKN